MGNDPWGPPPPPPPQQPPWQQPQQQQPQQQPQQPWQQQQQQPQPPPNWPGANPGQQQWPGQQEGMSVPPRSDKPVLALVFAILSFIACGCFSSLPALFIARTELAAIEQGRSSPEGKGMAQAAFWVAVANLVLYALVIVGYGLVFLIALIANIK